VTIKFSILPRQIPTAPINGGFEIHFNGSSHIPEKFPGPPHDSPSIFAQTLQHLELNKKITKYFSWLFLFGESLK
jgi:hypothetical protein